MYSEKKEGGYLNDNQRVVNHDSTTKSVSDFNVLLEHFTDEISNNKSLSTEIFKYVDNIKPFIRVESNLGNSTEVEPQGIIEIFQFQLNRLKEINSKFEKIAFHLGEIVGD